MNNGDDFFDRLRQQHSSGAVPDDNKLDAHDALPQATPRQNITSANGVSDEPITASINADSDANTTLSLPPEARRALVSLLRQGVILSSSKSKLFDSLCRYQVGIRRHLSDMYLALVLDDKAGVAFVTSVDEDSTFNGEPVLDSDSEESVSLITRRTLSLYDTLILLVLRKHYQDRETSGEQKVVIDIERIESNLTPFLPLTNNSKTDRRKLNAALKKMLEKKVLSSVRGSDDRYEITPIIRYVVNAEFLESMLLEYQKLASEAGLESNNTTNVDSGQDS